MSDYKGLSFYVCFGGYGGWRIKRDGPSIRVTLGWMGMAIMFVDIERFMGTVFDMLPREPDHDQTR